LGNFSSLYQPNYVKFYETTSPAFLGSLSFFWKENNMKKLISILGTIAFSTAPVVGIANITNSYTSDIDVTEPKLTAWIKEADEAKGTGIENAEKIISIYGAVPETIYYAMTRETLDAFMSHVYDFKSFMDTLNFSADQLNQITKIQFQIEKSYNNWLNTGSLDTMVEQYDSIASQEKTSLRKLYYAYKQNSSTLLIDDMEKYQPYREELAVDNAEKTQLQSEVGLLNKEIDEYGRMIEWQTRLKTIFDNWINKAQGLKDAFDDAFDSIGGDIANGIAKHFEDRNVEFLKKLVDDYFKDDEDEDAIYEQIKDNIKNRDVTSDPAALPTPPEWMTKTDGDASEDNDYNDQYTNEELAEIGKEQVDNQLPEGATKDEIIDKISDIVKQVYALDDIVFGKVHSAAQEFADFIGQISKLSDDVKASFDNNGIEYPTEVDEAVAEATKIGSAILGRIGDVFELGNFKKIADIVFSSIDEIQKWVTTLDVMTQSQDAIDAIKATEERVTQIPDDSKVDVEAVKNEIAAKSIEINVLTNRIDELTEIISHSQFDTLQANATLWNSEFAPFYDFVGIYTDQKRMLSTSFDGGDFTLNPRQYFLNSLNIYESLIINEELYYNKIMLTPDVHNVLGDKWVEMQTTHSTFKKLQSIIEEHKGEFTDEKIN
jgi:hypothetical protein